MERDSEVREIDLVDLFSFYFSKIVWIILAVAIGAIVAGVITKFAITPKYTATAKMYMVSSSTGSVVDLSDLNLGTSLSSDYIELIKTRPIVESVIDDLGLNYEYKDLISMMSLSVVSGTRIIRISVTSPNPEEARDIANELAVKAEQQLPILMETPKPSIAEWAITPISRSSPSMSRNVLIGALICLVIILAILTILYLRDDTLKSAEDVEKYFGVMPLTVIPEGQLTGAHADTTKKKSRFGKK